jgi:acetolactate synthase-1/2/3 large subunit
MASEQILGAEIIVKALIDQGVEVIFGYPGGAVLPLYDALFKQNQIKHILVRHEQAALHAAEGYARSTGKVGVVLVTSGPGATNAVTGLTDALMDSIPLVCLTGQVPTHLIGNDAFQEADTTGITRPCTKHNYLVKSITDLSRVMHEAFYVARSGRPGPVVVDLPKDIQQTKGDYVNHAGQRHRSYNPPVKPDRQQVEAAINLMATAVLYRRWCDQFRSGGIPVADRFHPHDRISLHPDVDGAGRFPGFRSALGRHGRHAWHV